MIKKVREYFDLIKFEHTVFALPFALAGMMLAKGGWPSLSTFLWVILAMVGGRTAAMACNRVIDADIDKKNPRTQNREIPSGKIKKSSATVLAAVGFIVMTCATLHLPLICIRLLPLAIVILILYSFTKRFTSFSHLVLGGALGAAASGGWLAVSGTMSLPVILWGLAVVFWVAGFDVIYAIQDIDFDHENGLFSIPTWVGVKNSLLISKLFHIITVVLLTFLGAIYPVSLFFWAGVAFTALMLVWEHHLLSEEDLSKINVAFFNINGYVSMGIFLFILAGKLFS